jgi:hypothetical protein
VIGAKLVLSRTLTLPPLRSIIEIKAINLPLTAAEADFSTPELLVPADC